MRCLMNWESNNASIIAAIYDGLDTDRGWLRLMQVLAQHFDAKGAHFFLYNRKLEEFVDESLYGVDGEIANLEGPTHTHHSDEFGFDAINVNGCSMGGISQSMFRGDLFQKAGLQLYLAMNIPINQELSAGFALLRPGASGPFLQSDAERLDQLRPHLLRTLQLQSRLRELEKTIEDPLIPSTSDQLESHFHMTPTEAFIAANLAGGKSLTQIAKHRRCQLSTVRTHVKSIFRKTDTNRQAELVRLVLTTIQISSN